MSTNTNAGVEGKSADKDGGGDSAGDGAQQRRKPLRQPLSPRPPDSRLEPNQQNNKMSSPGAQNSGKPAESESKKLSAEAPVFVPRAAAATSDQASAGYDTFDRLTSNRPAILGKTQRDSAELKLLKDSMFQLMSNPASFDELLKKLVDKFNQSVTNEKSLLEIIDIIYDLSIEEVNFRYTGARMCDYLSRYMKVETESGTFRQHLLKRLHQEFEKKNESIKNPKTIPRFHGFTLFVGELFENFKIKVDTTGKIERIRVLRNALQDLIILLLDHSNYENVKCAINVLKLTGAILEEFEIEHQGSQDGMNKIFSKVRQLSEDKNVHRHNRENLVKLITLRGSGWDRKSRDDITVPSENMNSLAAAAAAGVQEYSNEPVFFSPDGRQITPEEAGYFYEEYEEYPQEYYGNDYEYYDWQEDGDEFYDGAYVLDDEAEADYIQFLRESGTS
ncbi:polyadenylate-binding protein-interacting protein 1-like isoform X2 [Ptychodera flava]|uniref:polyadenylate-binding protein-interacting protein 1-like isoform X2 n=1 Tax=Ptychodera flava TaxID=63121 RepID=UPI00396A35CD